MGSSVGTGGMPGPPSVADIVASFAGPVYGFVSQSHLREFAATPASATGRMVQVSLSYTYLRVPARPTDPSNFVQLSPDQQRAIDAAEASSLPTWLKEQINRMRYPVLFEAVRTSLPIPSERAHPIESRLAAHLSDALHALQPQLATVESSHHGALRQLQDEDIRRGVPVLVDGEWQRSFRIDAHPEVIAVGLQLEDCFVTAVVPRAMLPGLDLSFVRR
ncbi:hypothetical protein HQQ81_14200 [Microbacteriaceae bacterium VKM Ac-2854]|nr:hypothetical protein [Microbacteriaceae bacterium VKM Ac-2854]